GVPVHWGTDFLGVLIVGSDTPAAFSPADAELLNLFAPQAAIAIRNARLYEEVQRLLEQQIAVNRLALALGEHRDLDGVYHAIYEHVRALMDADAFIVSFYDDERQLIQAEYVMSHGRIMDAAHLPLIPLEEAGHGTQSQVIHTGEPLYVPDWSQVTRTTKTQHRIAEDGTIAEGPPPPEARKDSTNSAVYVPMKVEGETIGVMQVQSRRPDAYNQEDIDLLAALANMAAMAIQNTRLYEESRSRTAHLEALNAIIAAAAAAPDISNLLDIALGHTLIALGLKTGYICLADQCAIQGLPPDFEPVTIQTNRDAGLDSPYPLAIEDWRRVREENPLSALAPFGGHPAIRASLSVPILVEEGCIGGGMTVASAEPRTWSSEEIALVEAVGRQLGAAAERLRLFQAEQEQRELAEALEEAASAVSSTLDLDEVLDRILEQVERIVPGDASSVVLIENGMARIVRWRGREYPNAAQINAPFPLADHPHLMSMAESGKATVISGSSPDSDRKARERWEWPCSHVGAPIQVAGETVGFLIVGYSQPDRFSPTDVERLEALTSHVATAVENARLFQEAQQRVAELEALQRTSLQLTSSLDLPAVLDTIVDSALNLVGASNCHIYLYDDVNESFTLSATLWEDGRREAAVKAPRRDGLTVTVARSGCPLVINDTTTHPLYTTPEAQKWNLKAIAGFPLKRAGRVLGVLTVAFMIPHTFSPEEQRVLGLLADQAATAVENAQLYRQLRDHAEQLEQRVQERTAQLEAQYARLNAILHSASDGIVVTDAQGEIVQTNPVAQTWLTRVLSPEDAVRLRETIRDLARRTVAEPAASSSEKERRPEVILELTGLDLELKSAPIVEPRMTRAAAVVGIHDISHLKALERMKSRFVTNVSHELRTPITTIKLYAALMQQTPPQSEKWEQYLNALAQEADHQARLVEDILRISRIDAGRLEMKPRPTPLNELTAAIVTSRQVLAERKGLTLEHRPMTVPPGERGPLTLVDPERMMQVLNNLLGNAIHYTPEGGKVIVSTGLEEAEGRTWATVRVSDTGIGIPEDELPHVFERFFRGAEPQSMQIPGTGLGLAIAREIVELHGGRVTLESAINEGTTFTVWLPLAG
ncbi:MAG: hypothetical protein DRI48_07300, partial [Chloroflexi bacterium]